MTTKGQTMTETQMADQMRDISKRHDEKVAKITGKPRPAVIAAMRPVAWRATKDGCEVGLFYDEDIARENTTDALIEPLFALSPRP